MGRCFFGFAQRHKQHRNCLLPMLEMMGLKNAFVAHLLIPLNPRISVCYTGA